MNLKPDILVVGAGIAGVTTAIALKRRGLSVLLVERDAQVRERFKGEYLQPIAVERLEKLGLGQVLSRALSEGRATAIRELRFRDLPNASIFKKSQPLQPVSDVLVRYPAGRYGVSIPQHELSARLRECARAELGENFIEGIDLKFTSKNWDRPVFSGIRGGQKIRVYPKLVLGADGRNSTVRSWMEGPKAPAGGSPTWGSDPEFLVGVDFEVNARLAHRYEVIRTAGEGTFSFFQLSEARQRLYWNTSDSKAGKTGWKSKIETLLKSAVSCELQQDAPLGNLAGAPADTAWMGPAFRGRFLLMADALAVTTPLGGQGMAAALEHAERLVDGIPKLFTVRAGRPSRFFPEKLSSLGRLHHRASRRYFRHINLMNLFLYHLCFSRARLTRHLSRHVFHHWNENPEAKRLVAEYFAGSRVEGLTPIRIAELLGIQNGFRSLLLGLQRS